MIPKNGNFLLLEGRGACVSLPPFLSVILSFFQLSSVFLKQSMPRAPCPSKKSLLVSSKKELRPVCKFSVQSCFLKVMFKTLCAWNPSCLLLRYVYMSLKN